MAGSSTPIPPQGLLGVPHPHLDEDSLAEDHPILQPLLEVRPDLLPRDGLDPRPQLSLLLWVVLLGELGGDSEGDAQGQPLPVPLAWEWGWGTSTVLAIRHIRHTGTVPPTQGSFQTIPGR